MDVDLRDNLQNIFRIAGFDDVPINLMAMDLSEIEQEAETSLDLLTALRSHAYRGDATAVQESLAELSICLEHLQSHIQHLLPDMQNKLDITG